MRRTDPMLTDAQRTAYERDGCIVVPNVFSPAEIDELRRVTNEFVRNAAAVTANDEVSISKIRIRARSRGCAG
jgi:hypothetical protein